MATVTVNVSFPERLLKAMDKLAKREDRTRSDVLREAVRMYLEQKGRLQDSMSLLRAEARKADFKPEDVASWVAEVRKAKKAA